jgi:hypothetical protein
MNERSAAAYICGLRRTPQAQLTVMALALLLGNSGCVAADPPPVAAPPASSTVTCLPGERGFFQASLRGALDLKPDWHGAQLQCEGGVRPNARGLRLSFGAVLPDSERTLRIVFGIAAAPGVPRSRAVPANVTIIVEGESRIYSTLGDDKCTVEALLQERLPQSEVYRVAARGFCTAPAVKVGGTERLYIDRFDFAGSAQLEEQTLEAARATL